MSDHAATLTRNQVSLLLYLESTLVEYGGTVESNRMNKDDFDDVPRLTEAGLIAGFKRVPAKLLGTFARHVTHTVDFTEEGWRVAHQLRRERAERARVSNSRAKIDAYIAEATQ